MPERISKKARKGGTEPEEEDMGMMEISPLFSDGAVLCRGRELRIFGRAEDGARIHCELLSEKEGLIARGDGIARGGQFLIPLPPQEARTGCRLVITDGKDIFHALDICIGEVFLAGGQSNMEMELRSAEGGPEAIAEHVNPMVRYFNVPKAGTFTQEREEAWKAACWQAVGPGRAGDISAAAYFFAMKLQLELGVPVGIVDCYLGGTSVTCWMDEAWLNRTGEGQRYLREYRKRTAGLTLEESLEADRRFRKEMEDWCAAAEAWQEEHPGADRTEMEQALGPFPWNPPEGPASCYRPGGLFDTMVAPLTPLSLTGILFYQGEEDTGRTEAYDVLMMSLIDRWRTAFRDESLPFLFVQLPMWRAKDAEDSKTWAALRLRQAEVRDRMRNTGMVCLLDQGEFDNIHPGNKRVVGERLFGLAMKEIWHRGGEASPRILGRRTEEGMLTLEADLPLTTSDGREPALLEVAEEGGSFVPARAMIEGNLLHLTAPGVRFPLHARYAWTDYGTVNLFGPGGLPLEPFAR